MNMSVLPILASRAEDGEMRAALATGWKRRDLWWERSQEAGNAGFEKGNLAGAARAWRRAAWIARFGFAADDPRQATTLANLALLDRHAGYAARADARYARALRIWGNAPGFIDRMQIASRARSSLFHLRMEALHWNTYQDNMRARFRAFAAETAQALDALGAGQPVTCRLYSRWRGEKPSVFDDTRRFLGAALLIGGGAARVATGANRPKDQKTPAISQTGRCQNVAST